MENAYETDMLTEYLLDNTVLRFLPEGGNN